MTIIQAIVTKIIISGTNGLKINICYPKYALKLGLILFGFTTTLSCKKNITGNTSFKSYTYKHQEWRSKRVTQYSGDVDYSAIQVPLQYYLSKQLGGNTHNKIDSIAQNNAKERIIEFEFQHIESKDLLQPKFTNLAYQQGVTYMAFKIKKDFWIITSHNDTIPCVGVHFERNFKVAPYKKLMLYFNNINPNTGIKLVYNDQLFGNGLFEFNFSETPLKL